MLHVRLKRRALGRVFRTGVEKHHHLILRKKVSVQIAPIGGGIKPEVVLRRQRRKPSLGFPDETDMCRILLGGIERDHAKRRLIGARPGTAIDDRGTLKPLRAVMARLGAALAPRPAARDRRSSGRPPSRLARW